MRVLIKPTTGFYLGCIATHVGSEKYCFCFGGLDSEMYARLYLGVCSRTRRCELPVSVLVIFMVAPLNLCVIRVGGVVYAAQLSLFCIVYPSIRP